LEREKRERRERREGDASETVVRCSVARRVLLAEREPMRRVVF
jgi:hypothetical protein